MTKTITLEEASARFADVLRAVESGEEYLLTRDGREVARITPTSRSGERKLTPEQEAAWRRTLTRMEQGWTSDGEPFDRDAIHER